ncbi:hypothetical protein ACSTG3_23810, partial [Vibrio parahaemolyticus]
IEVVEPAAWLHRLFRGLKERIPKDALLNKTECCCELERIRRKKPYGESLKSGGGADQQSTPNDCPSAFSPPAKPAPTALNFHSVP